MIFVLLVWIRLALAGQLGWLLTLRESDLLRFRWLCVLRVCCFLGLFATYALSLLVCCILFGGFAISVFGIWFAWLWASFHGVGRFVCSLVRLVCGFLVGGGIGFDICLCVILCG